VGDAEQDETLGRIGRGEREVILLARELGGQLAVLLDDAAARRLARAEGLLVYGCAGILVLAKERGAISNVWRELEVLLEAGLYLDDRIQREALDAAGEVRGELPPLP